MMENLVNIGPGNGLPPGGSKPLPEPMLTYHQLSCSQQLNAIQWWIIKVSN